MVLDSSTLISLARAGLLPLLGKLPADPVIIDVVETEVVEEGLSHGYPDAAAIEAAIAPLARQKTGSRPTTPDVDTTVLQAARANGTLVANDLALGRRARNFGVRWLRTADLVVLLSATEAITAEEAQDAITALAQAGRLSAELAHAYLEEVRS